MGGLTIRMWRLGFVCEQWAVPGHFKAGQHNGNMGIWGKNESGLQDGLAEEGNEKVAVAVRDVR